MRGNTPANREKPRQRTHRGAQAAFWIIFGLFLLISAWLRIGVPYDDLMGDTIRFPSVDAYYHLMLADNTYDNWPEVQTHNQLLSWPEGQAIGQMSLNAWLIATIAKFGGFSVDAVGAYWPAILGVLVLIPALFIGWLLWGRWGALIGVVLLATIQGEFLGRTSLGFCDQHALEVFSTVTIVLFLILSLKRHWLWAFGGGFFLGLHLLNWAGGPLMSLVILLFLVIQVIRNHWKGQSNRVLCLSTFIIFGVSFGIFALFRWEAQMYTMFLGVATVVPLGIYEISKRMARYKPIWYPVALGCVAVIGVIALCLVFPKTIEVAFAELSRLKGGIGSYGVSAQHTVSEVQTLFFPYGEFTTSLVWGGYGLVFLVGLAGLVLLGLRSSRPEALFVFLWSLAMLAITLMQRRFGYYLAVNLCLLSGYVCWAAIQTLGRRRLSAKQAKRKGIPRERLSGIVVAVGIGIIAVAMLIPNSMISARQGKHHAYAISPAWSEAVEFLKMETPQTGDYGVLTWWDYGYWVTREAKRAVLCHPGGGNSGGVAFFFTAQTIEEADAMINRVAGRYVVIDYQMVTSKFYAMPILANRKAWTEANYVNSVVYRLYYSDDGIEGYREVFESKVQYEGHSQVKIYERYVPEPEPQKGCGCE